MKKRVSWLLALALCLPVIRQTAVVAEENTVEVNGLVFTEMIGCYSLTDCTDKSITTVTIPGEVNGMPVTSISYSFRDCVNLEEILVDDAMEASGYFTSVDGVLFNGNEVVELCPPAKAGAFVIPEGTAAIEAGAFAGCSALTSITIPDSVSQVGEGSFDGCSSLESIVGTLPASGLRSFEGCKKLQALTMSNNGRITAFVLDGLDSLEQVKIEGSGLFSLGLHVQNCRNLRSFRVPEAEDWAFSSYYDAVRSLKLKMVVSDCPALEELYIPSYIESASVSECENLKTIVLLKNAGEFTRIADCPSVTTILDYADSTTFFYQDDNSVNTALTESSGLIVYGYQNGAAEKACDNLNVSFRPFGDVNGDNKVSLADVVLLNKHLMIGTPVEDAGKIAADVDHSGAPDEVDSLSILKYLIHLIDSFGVA